MINPDLTNPPITQPDLQEICDVNGQRFPDMYAGIVGGLVLVLAAGAPNQVAVLTLTASGVLADTGQRINLGGVVSGQANGARCIVITPNGHLAFVTDSVRNLVSVLTIANGTVTLAGTIGNLGSLISGIAITPNGQTVYVSNFGNSTLAVLSISSTDTVADTGVRITVAGGTPSTFFGVPGIAVTPDGAKLLVSGYMQGKISILDTATHSVLTVLTAAPEGPAGIGVPRGQENKQR